MQKWVVNRLLPRIAALCGHDWGDDVHDLRDAGDFNAVAVIQQLNQHPTDDKRVLHRVHVLEPGRGMLPGF